MEESRGNAEWYRLVPRQVLPLIEPVLAHFCGDAFLSLEGEFPHRNLEVIPGIQYSPTETLPRNTLSKSDFVIIPLETETLPLILKYVTRQVGLRSNVRHILVEKRGQLVFWAYDSMDSEMVAISARVGTAFLEELVRSKGIWSYYALPPH